MREGSNKTNQFDERYVVLSMKKAESREITNNARKNIQHELKETIFNSNFFLILVAIGHLTKIIISFIFISIHWEDCVSGKLLIWFLLMILHDFLYIGYNILMVLHQNKSKKSSNYKNSLKEPLEMEIIGVNRQLGQKNEYSFEKDQNSTHEPKYLKVLKVLTLRYENFLFF